MTSNERLRVAVIGGGFMGRMHTQAWRTAPRFFRLPRRVEPAVLVGRRRDGAADASALGWPEYSDDWREVVEREDIDVVDVCTPGDTHAEIALAALAAGKHVLCEKPLANSVEDADRMADAAAAATGVAMCGFSYRRTPALALARSMITDGWIGAIRHVRAQYLQDWLSDPDAPHTWRLDRDRAGSGALGDIGAHSIDTAQWLTGDRIAEVSATVRTFVPDRPPMARANGLGGTGARGARLPVTVDDAVAFTARFEGGALGVFEATRMATGRRNANRIEINGSAGSIAFDFERMNELEYYDAADAAGRQGFRRIQATESEHPYAGAWWPAGHGLGYEHLFVHQVVDFVWATVGATDAGAPTFGEAADLQRVLAAVEQSAANDAVMRTVRRRTEQRRDA
ncbi:dehydrogenase [Agromyces rhizosphaerae]|uniref:Dehydrogenase n=1 Tax=Agromyces rhizosphaerae TaxID=88374 RepID=A0A9W6CWQ2_9MICO|nr:Gfo/Idh/MocA family oxidoreductase [Agromyces rhizosphaerae]GLI26632.1 dehydrogenase [Agromyces rhizosphaerae]